MIERRSLKKQVQEFFKKRWKCKKFESVKEKNYRNWVNEQNRNIEEFMRQKIEKQEDNQQ